MFSFCAVSGTACPGRLVVLEPPRFELIPSLHSQFRRVAGEVPSFKMLPAEHLLEVLSSAKRVDLFLGGIVDEGSGTLALTRGDLTTLVVPLSMFPATGPSKPDFGKFELDDYGYTIRFGDFEASAHSVLYRVDPEYRHRANRAPDSRREGLWAFFATTANPSPNFPRRFSRHLAQDDCTH